VKDIEFSISPKEIHPKSEIKGTITVSYPGRYDGVVINTQILDSNEHIIYKSYNGKKISMKNKNKIVKVLLIVDLNCLLEQSMNLCRILGDFWLARKPP